MKKIFVYISIAIAGLAVVAALVAYVVLFKANTNVTDSPAYIYVKTGSNYQDVLLNLKKDNLIQNEATFEFVAKLKKYPQNIKAGKYRIKSGQSNLQLINMLRGGQQEPVKLLFSNARSVAQLAGLFSHQLEADSLSLIEAFTNDSVYQTLGFNEQTLICNFIPNTYEVFWNIKPQKLFLRLNQEYVKFWNSERKAKAAEIPLTPFEVMSLASIVDEESWVVEDYPIIAGVYVNRLKLGMLLQADPTVKFALGDFSIKRILNRDLSIDSPYNTYRYKGLPPGPISMPSIKAIDAVLNYQKHDYLYFCAKEDFSGHHRYARTMAEHQRNAQIYQKALTNHKIMR
jgi:UPF0755 protein